MAHPIHLHGARAHPDHAVARLAARQHGIVSAAQLAACGLSPRRIDVRVRGARLFRVHVGVPAVGLPPATDLARWTAAVLATDGRLSHRSAAALHGVWANGRGAEHVTVLRGARRPRPGLVVHRVRRLDDADVTRRAGIPVTAVLRTLLDLAAELRPRQLDRALREARAGTLATDDELRDVLARHPRRPGGPALARALLGPFTRSQLERRLLALVAEAGLPRPLTNAEVLGEEADAWWPEARLVVELDGRATHGITAAIARDAAKDARLRVAGVRVERLTWWDVVRDARRTAARLADLAHPVHR